MRFKGTDSAKSATLIGKKLGAGLITGRRIHTSHLVEESGPCCAGGGCEVRRNRRRPRRRPQPFQRGAPSPQPISFQAEPRRRSYGVALTWLSIGSGVWRSIEIVSHSSDSTICTALRHH
jgi:hypothetical protein